MASSGECVGVAPHSYPALAEWIDEALAMEMTDTGKRSVMTSIRRWVGSLGVLLLGLEVRQVSK